MNRKGLTLYNPDGSVTRLNTPEWDAPLGALEARWLEEGRVLRNGKAMPKDEEAHIKAAMLRVSAPQRSVVDPSLPEFEHRLYIPGLMSHETSPAFIAPKGWGKTKFLCELGAALVIPGRRFLKHFDPVQVTDEERARDVWLINPETPVWAVHRELLRVGLVFGYRDGTPCYRSPDHEDGQGVLIVEHLVETEASEFDLTDPVQFEWWYERVEHSGTPPLTFIADSITSIIDNQTSRTAEFTARFKDFLKRVDIPNALGVLHSPMGVNTDTPMQGLESWAQWDGSWIGRAKTFPIRPEDKRYFYTVSRLNDEEPPESQIVMDEDGTLRLVPPDPSKKDEDAPKESRREYLLATLAKADEPMWTRNVCRPGDDYAKDKAELERLREAGEVTKEHVQRGRTRGDVWALPTALEGDADGVGTALEVREETE